MLSTGCSHGMPVASHHHSMVAFQAVTDGYYPQLYIKCVSRIMNAILHCYNYKDHALIYCYFVGLSCMNL